MWLTELKIILNLSILTSPKQIPLPEKKDLFLKELRISKDYICHYICCLFYEYKQQF